MLLQQFNEVELNTLFECAAKFGSDLMRRRETEVFCLYVTLEPELEHRPFLASSLYGLHRRHFLVDSDAVFNIFIARPHSACNAERYNTYGNSVRPSVRMSVRLDHAPSNEL